MLLLAGIRTKALRHVTNYLTSEVVRWVSLQRAYKLLPGGEAEAFLLHPIPSQVQQALHKRTARLKKAGHRVARKQQELMHVVHVSADLRKASSCTVLPVACLSTDMMVNKHRCESAQVLSSRCASQVYIGDEYDMTRNGTR